MGPQRKATDPAAEDAPARLRVLLGDGVTLTAQELADRLVLTREGDAPPRRPYLLLNMIATADGRASLGGRSGPLGNRADRELFHALRTVVDAVMAGAGTVRAERYGPIVRAPERRRARRERGLEEEPLACIVSGRMALAPQPLKARLVVRELARELHQRVVRLGRLRALRVVAIYRRHQRCPS